MFLFLGFIWSIWSVWFNQTNETNQTDQMNRLVVAFRHSANFLYCSKTPHKSRHLLV